MLSPTSSSSRAGCGATETPPPACGEGPIRSQFLQTKQRRSQSGSSLCHRRGLFDLYQPSPPGGRFNKEMCTLNLTEFKHWFFLKQLYHLHTVYLKKWGSSFKIVTFAKLLRYCDVNSFLYIWPGDLLWHHINVVRICMFTCKLGYSSSCSTSALCHHFNRL